MVPGEAAQHKNILLKKENRSNKKTCVQNSVQFKKQCASSEEVKFAIAIARYSFPMVAMDLASA